MKPAIQLSKDAKNVPLAVWLTVEILQSATTAVLYAALLIENCFAIRER